MDYRKKRSKSIEIGMALVCLVAVLLSIFSIYSTYQVKTITLMIYDHPYTVSNEARAMYTRLLDMRSFLLGLIAEPTHEVEKIQQMLDERYSCLLYTSPSPRD